MSYLLIVIVFLVPLPDFSRAGCDVEIRDRIPSHKVNILDFGAIPNDEIDDSDAIHQAIESISTTGGTVLFPKGVFVLEKRIHVRTNRIHLLGDGTTLMCPMPLADVYGENKNWSWSSGFLILQPIGDTKKLGELQQNAEDGATTIKVDWEKEPPLAGEWVQLWWFNDIGEDTLLRWLYGDSISPSKYGKELQESTSRRIASWFRVVSVHGDTVTLDPPLPLPAEVRWNVQVMEIGHLENCIVENLHFDFVEAPYPGHLQERGHNAIAGSNLVQCLFKNISTSNADSGIFLGSCGFTTVEGFETSGRFMHHPICLSTCSHCLIKEFALNAPHRHGTTISWCSHFNVFANGSGNELAMDSHRACSFRNLHQNITIQHGENPKQPLRSGGAYARGLHSARENVYWNIKHIFPTQGEPFKISYLQDWPLGVFVGWHGNREIILEAELEGQTVNQTNTQPTEAPY